ncbi:P-loop containing nucleoside triphosphate hydrolase protein [Triangularia verruculosa]|uniref:P-loop containing nucleoside triphosphate hydrolase protein n=1 Tax=Triangularia verruculosa TaxID=2587418 RepID=A0AAN6XRA1_9PEZI|nr:P-loop containing nucleoside triphosphate hydrolase protein [Triangularia verruculosa]
MIRVGGRIGCVSSIDVVGYEVVKGAQPQGLPPACPPQSSAPVSNGSAAYQSRGWSIPRPLWPTRHSDLPRTECLIQVNSRCSFSSIHDQFDLFPIHCAHRTRPQSETPLIPIPSRHLPTMAAMQDSGQTAIRRKLVIIGDGACGKTSLLSVFTLGFFPTHYIPTVFENYVTDCKVDGKNVQLALWDTAGQEDYERLRPLAYSKAHVILIGFSVDTPDSLDNVKHKVGSAISPMLPSHGPLSLSANPHAARLRAASNVTVMWVVEAQERCPEVPIILVGLKKDLREDPVAIEEMRKKSLKFLTTSEGEHAAKEIGARKYLECSSLTGEGVDDVFEAATRASLLMFEKSEGGGCCVIL